MALQNKRQASACLSFCLLLGQANMNRPLICNYLLLFALPDLYNRRKKPYNKDGFLWKREEKQRILLVNKEF